MKFTLEESLTIMENLIKVIKSNADKNEELVLRLEATLKCFQHHVRSLK